MNDVRRENVERIREALEYTIENHCDLDVNDNLQLLSNAITRISGWFDDIEAEERISANKGGPYKSTNEAKAQLLSDVQMLLFKCLDDIEDENNLENIESNLKEAMKMLEEI